jgi:hypothetical protein
MSDIDHAETLNRLQQLEENGKLKSHLAIVRISEPIFSPGAENSSQSLSKRTSDASTIDNPTPASLEADLTHYKVGTNFCF